MKLLIVVIMSKKMAVIVIEEWMIEDARLSGLDLLAFALIHGCTQNGDGCWYGGYDNLAKRIGGKQRGTILAINRLEEMGAIKRSDALIDGKTRKIITAIWNSAKNTDAKNTEEPLQKMQSFTAQNTEPSNNKEIKIKKIYSESVERVYALYPSSTIRPEGNTVTLKSAAVNKKMIERLLKTDYTEEQLSYAINRYVSETNPKYLKVFSTFLNQVPDYSSQSSPSPQVAPTPSREEEMQKATHPTKEEVTRMYNKFFLPIHPMNDGETQDEYKQRIRPFWEREYKAWIERRVTAVNNKY